MSAAHVRSYRIAAHAQPKDKGREGAQSFTLTVPPKIARLIPAEQEFAPELTEDGILYRPVENTVKEVPSWIK